MKTVSFLRITCIILLSLLHFKIQASDTIKVFSSYRAYRDNNPSRTSPKLLGYNALGRGMAIDVIKDGKQEKIPCAEMWGFLYKGFLFRTDNRTGQVAMLISQGKICYYENGAANIEMLKKGIKQSVTWLGYQCYFSEDLDSEMAPTPTPGNLSDAWKLIKRFWKQHPQYDLLNAYIDKNYDYVNVRDQVKKFEQAKLY